MKGLTTKAGRAPREMENPLLADFPVIMEKGKPKAVVVDVKVLRQLQVIIDNALRREPEAEDVLIATSTAFHRLLARVDAEDPKPSPNWRKELLRQHLMASC